MPNTRKLMCVDQSELLPRRENIAAVMVTYHPEGDLVGRVQRVLPQVQLVVVVDNSASRTIAALLGELEAIGVGCVRNPHNFGLGAALNQGIQRAAEMGFPFVLTLDQDTVVDEDMVATLIHVWSAYPCPQTLAVLGSNSRSPTSGRVASRRRPTSQPFTEEKVVITSGSLISIPVYREIGPMRSDFFIDGIDLEYCLRARAYGFKILRTRQALMTHNLDRTVERRFLWRMVLVEHHEPWRHYHTGRNLLCIFRLYFWREPAFVFSASFYFAKTLVKTALFEKQRLRKLISIVSGIKDGFLFPLGAPQEPRRARD